MPHREYRFTLQSLPTDVELKTLPKDGGPKWNRLVFEKSPYLLQHAANPVNWFPWGDEAFEEARRLDKPVFLSIGYATCHWCHVMEHESFENASVAKLMNETFICVKVDREERPDIDHVYMSVTQAMTGQGGWPMTVVMTPDRKPFFAGTYLPRESHYGRPGMVDFVPHIRQLWKDDRAHLVEMSEYITSQLRKISTDSRGDEPTPALLTQAYAELRGRFDPTRGGFGERPKFPVPHNLSFLLRYHLESGDAEALTMVTKTLTEMRLGGIYDHIGFGFHRYSTDRDWLVPHFEKMLYDQALLAIVYTEAWQVTRDPLFLQTADEILSYVTRDMTAPEGGFYSAEDADSEGEEGKFNTWTSAEVRTLLGPDADAFLRHFGFEEDGNFSEESTGHRMGTNIPHLSSPPANGKTFERERTILFDAREKRIHPLKDDKILTDWNGLMIAAFAKYARATRDVRALATASRAADFCLAKLRTKDGRLIKRYRGGDASLPAHLEDYAFLAYGLAELYEASLDSRYLVSAVELCDAMLKHFSDPEGGGFFQTADDGEKLIVRSKDIYDGAIPSGNSVAAYTLIRIARMTGRTDFESRANDVLKGFSGTYGRGSSQFSFSMMAAQLAMKPSTEVVIAGDRDDATFAEMMSVLNVDFLPDVVVVYRPSDEKDAVFQIAPNVRANIAVNGKATAYVCQNFSCKNPVHSANEMLGLLHVQKNLGPKI